MLHRSVGVLRYSGKSRLVVEADQGVSDFYRSLIPKYMPHLKPRWPAHITVVREEKEEPSIWDAWGRYEGMEIPFVYESEVKWGKVYFWLNVYCARLGDIRLELGLERRSSYTLPPGATIPGYEGLDRSHMTIANMKF